MATVTHPPFLPLHVMSNFKDHMTALQATHLNTRIKGLSKSAAQEQLDRVHTGILQLCAWTAKYTFKREHDPVSIDHPHFSFVADERTHPAPILRIRNSHGTLLQVDVTARDLKRRLADIAPFVSTIPSRHR